MIQNILNKRLFAIATFSFVTWPLLTGCVEEKEADYAVERIKKENTVIDCNGDWYNKGTVTELQILASNVAIRRCKINGSVRIVGLGNNGEAKAVKESSLSIGHTERAQAAAPSNTHLWKVTITGHGRIPLYIAPGVTNTVLADSTINGKSSSVALYLDAESANNIIRSNTFNVDNQFAPRQFRPREVIAVDGSANNHIIGNTINKADNGGIYLYRNCGEGGTIRHQSPTGNLIAGNTIDISNISIFNYGIWLGSRNGNRLYCDADKGFDFGSSVNDGDFANDNTVRDNRFIGMGRDIKDDGQGNIVTP